MTRSRDLDELDDARHVSHAPARFRRLSGVLTNLLLLGLLYFLCLCLYIDYYGHIDRARPAQAIIILGARVEANHQPGDSLLARTRQAVSLYDEQMADAIICTGGLGDYPPTEAQAAAKLAMKLGVPKKVLLLEDTSTSTMENARNAAAICRQHGWTKVVVVSDPYHLWRAQRNFQAFGITAYTSPAMTCEREQKLALRLLWDAREGMAMTRDFLQEGLAYLTAKVKRRL